MCTEIRKVTTPFKHTVKYPIFSMVMDFCDCIECVHETNFQDVDTYNHNSGSSVRVNIHFGIVCDILFFSECTIHSQS